MRRLIPMLLGVLMLLACVPAFAESDEVQVTVPAAIYGDLSETEIQAAAAESGFTGCTINPDGSITYTMARTLQSQLVEAYELGIIESMAAYLYGEQRVPCFISITPDEGYARFDVMVDADKYTGMEYMCGITFLYGGSFYQHFSGLPLDKVEVVVNFIDSASGETLHALAYSELF